LRQNKHRCASLWRDKMIRCTHAYERKIQADKIRRCLIQNCHRELHR
jgi:hypothetical protein